MTDYGPGHGGPWQSEPWHPEDPLYGDPLGDGRDAYGRQPGTYQQYDTGQYPQVQPPAGYPAAQFPHQQGYPPQQPYGAPEQQWDTGQHPVHDPRQAQGYGWPAQAGYQPGPYDTGQFAAPGYPAQTYGGDHATGQFDTGQLDAYAGQQPGYPPPGAAGHPQPPAAAQQAPARPAPPGPRKPVAPEPPAEWNPFDEDDDGPETHPFFTGDDADAPAADKDPERRRPRPSDDDDDDYDDRGSRPAARDAKRPKKRRSGCACLTMVLLLGGLVCTGGYFGRQFYENHYAPPPDYAGQGTTAAQVEIPNSATLADIGNILKKAGVVESVDAFTKAAAANPKGTSIQGGIYVLKKHMSAASAVAMMLDPAAQSALIVPEGWRASQIYQALDKKLGLKPGTTAAAVKTAKLGLPSYDRTGKPEGFLYPAKYGAAKGGDPIAILRQMVSQGQTQFARDDLTAKAAELGETPFQIIVIASLIQAEAQEPQDFGKVSRVIYNRLHIGMKLGFDSTLNYATGVFTLNHSDEDTQYPSPYNTYKYAGLPPGPIDNPGAEAMKAALNPTPGKWLYFVTVKPGDTRFDVTEAEHDKNVAAFDAYNKSHGGG